eukprot:m.53702 g.53702  ORF g.53702 m.53702 type:complete len:169 (+) comp6511_c1_seq1:62-568(+)
MGSTMALDDDITPTSDSNPLNNFEGVADRIYLHALPYLMQMTDLELIGAGIWAGGGTATTWPYGNGTITYAKLGSRFVPAVVPPPAGSPPEAPTTLHPSKVYIYEAHAGATAATVDQQWPLPPAWAGKTLHAETITPTGREAGPDVTIFGGSIHIAVQPGRPVVLTAL